MIYLIENADSVNNNVDKSFLLN